MPARAATTPRRMPLSELRLDSMIFSESRVGSDYLIGRYCKCILTPKSTIVSVTVRLGQPASLSRGAHAIVGLTLMACQRA